MGPRVKPEDDTLGAEDDTVRLMTTLWGLRKTQPGPRKTLWGPRTREALRSETLRFGQATAVHNVRQPSALPKNNDDALPCDAFSPKDHSLRLYVILMTILDRNHDPMRS